MARFDNMNMMELFATNAMDFKDQLNQAFTLGHKQGWEQAMEQAQKNQDAHKAENVIKAMNDVAISDFDEPDLTSEELEEFGLKAKEPEPTIRHTGRKTGFTSPKIMWTEDEMSELQTHCELGFNYKDILELMMVNGRTEKSIYTKLNHLGFKVKRKSGKVVLKN